jgi:hypothetical protein
MNEYPDWVGLLSYLGLDPITVWVEYRSYLYLAVVALVLLLAATIYFFAVRIQGIIANYKHSFADRMAFYRSVFDLDEKYHKPLFDVLGPEELVYAVPAIAADDVPGFRKTVGHILLTKTRLIFTSNGQQLDFPLDAFNDANVKDGNKYMELKLIFDNHKPVFHMLGISRDHAQELFMKMHSFRVAIKENRN